VSIKPYVDEFLLPKSTFSIEVIRVSSLPDDIRVKIESFLQKSSSRFAKKQCCDNAVLAMSIDSKIEYVEGVIGFQGKIPIEHAWNKYNGFYFDVTAELYFDGDICRTGRGQDYVSIQETKDRSQAREWANSVLRALARVMRIQRKEKPQDSIR